MSDHVKPVAPYIIRDNGENILRHSVLPQQATLQCKASAAIPYRDFVDNDATRAAHKAIGDIATRQLPLGSAARITDAGSVRNELGRMESPLATLCRIGRHSTPQR